ncbi:hypothetical protein [Ralstonia flatus]|uniref:Transmembrane protein n=1 Tax=Ralstonia flatus TaxID=3058601 RepID=A0ABM9KZG4_9RALS|nr:hypothetical protein [Ralstonia sp. LMG 32965]MBN6209436.1 hypothetical protein [Ralstonia pickettii]CAJ0893468.1 hypothetical protein R77564_03715 [Ralstonia sp. LMG 32965]
MSYQDSENYRNDNGTFNYSNTYSNLNGSGYDQERAGVDGFDTPESAAAKLDAYRFKQMMEPVWFANSATGTGETSTNIGPAYGGSSYVSSGDIDLGGLFKGLLALLGLVAGVVTIGFVPGLLTAALLGWLLYKNRWRYATAIVVAALGVIALFWVQTGQLAGKTLFHAGVAADLLILPWAAFACLNHRVIAKRAKNLAANWSARNVFALFGIAVAVMTVVSMLLVITPLSGLSVPVRYLLTSVVPPRTLTLLSMMNADMLLILVVAAMPASTVMTYASAWFRHREAAGKSGAPWWLVALSVPAWAWMLLFAGLLGRSMVHNALDAQALQPTNPVVQQVPSSPTHTHSARIHREHK